MYVSRIYARRVSEHKRSDITTSASPNQLIGASRRSQTLAHAPPPASRRSAPLPLGPIPTLKQAFHLHRGPYRVPDPDPVLPTFLLFPNSCLFQLQAAVRPRYRLISTFNRPVKHFLLDLVQRPAPENTCT